MYGIRFYMLWICINLKDVQKIVVIFVGNTTIITPNLLGDYDI